MSDQGQRYLHPLSLREEVTREEAQGAGRKAHDEKRKEGRELKAGVLDFGYRIESGTSPAGMTNETQWFAVMPDLIRRPVTDGAGLSQQIAQCRLLAEAIQIQGSTHCSYRRTKSMERFRPWRAVLRKEGMGDEHKM